MRIRSLLCVLALVVLASGGAAYAGDGVVALQTAAASCRDDSGDRYVDCENGTVTDNVTGLVWLKNALCWKDSVTGDPVLDWHEALVVVANLADLPGEDPDDCGLSDGSSPGEWRLATKGEWEAMIADAKAMACDPAITSDSGNSCWDPLCFAFGFCSFSGVQSWWYWSSTSDVSDPEYVWTCGLGELTDCPNRFSLHFTHYVWPVRGGQ